MTLEEFMGKLNANVFLKEFTFSKNTFSPTPGQELELADQIVWLDNLLIAFQLKERTPIPDPTPESERKWFESKIQKKATKQIRDTLRYLEEHREIEIQNQRGHKFKIGASAKSIVDKVVVYIPGPKLPIECRRIKQYASDTAGFIHIMPAEDYLGICRTLLTPTEIHEYLAFREGLISRWPQEAETVSEQSLVGQFLAGTLDDSKPSEKNIQYLYSLNNSTEEFSLRRFMEVFAERIEHSTQENGYYFILSEIAKLNRTEAKAFKERFVLSLEDCKSKEVQIPYRVYFPRTGCGFAFVPVPNKKEFIERRLDTLADLTLAATYDTKPKKQIGASFARDGEYILIEWCLTEAPFNYSPEMEDRLRNNFPFRVVKETFPTRYRFEP